MLVAGSIVEERVFPDKFQADDPQYVVIERTIRAQNVVEYLVEDLTQCQEDERGARRSVIALVLRRERGTWD